MGAILNINQAFSDCAAAISIDSFEYRAMPYYALNMQDNTPQAQVFWVLADWIRTRNDKDAIVPPREYQVRLEFVKNNLLTAAWDEKMRITDNMLQAYEQFRSAFESHSIMPREIRDRVSDIYDKYDENRTGVRVILTFKINGTIC